MVEPVRIKSAERGHGGCHNRRGQGSGRSERHHSDAKRKDKSMRHELGVPAKRQIRSDECEPMQRVEQKRHTLAPEWPPGGVVPVPQRYLSSSQRLAFEVRDWY